MEIKPSLRSFSSENNNPNSKIKKKNKKEFVFTKCCINFCRKISMKKKKYYSKCPIILQFFFVIFPISVLIYIVFMAISFTLFDAKFKLDYFTLIKDGYLKNLITDIDDIRFDLRLNEIKTHFDDKSKGLFFKFYLEELISLGLLDDDKVKIFPNISNITNTFYKFIEEEENNNSIYSISSNISKKYIDERNDSFSELAKIYFHFYPLLSSEGIMSDSHVNQAYLIAYEIDNNKNILGDELYFNFPRLFKENLKDNIFSAGSNLKSPKICKQKQTYKLNNNYYEGNYFTIQDYEFRKASSKENNFEINIWHLNDISKGNISKSSIESMQMYFNEKEKEYIINILYYHPQEKIIKNFFDYTVLFVDKRSNSDYCIKYSDNSSFVISRNDITELVLSTLPSEYFHFGIKGNDYNFYRHGIFFDNFEIDHLSESTKYYSSLKGFNLDLRYFSSFYLYTKLFEKTSFQTSFSKTHNIKIFLFDDKDTIQDICSKFDFNLYKSYLKSNDLDCLDESNLYYYSYNNEEDESIAEIVSLPLCICIPLYCIQDVKDIFQKTTFLFVEKLSLPEKCQNRLFFYDNINKNTEDDDNNINEIDSGYLTSILLENQHLKFGIKNFELFNDLIYSIICIFDNKSLKIILYNFINEINEVGYIFSYMTMTKLSLIFILSYIFLLEGTKKISNIVYGYKEKLIQFIINYEKNVVINSQNNDNSKNNKYDEFLLGSKKEDIIPYIKYEDLISEEINKNKKSINFYENGLINDLFLIYCDYKRTSEEKIFNSKFVFKNKSKAIYEILTDSNELIKIFCVMSIHIPKFISNVNFNYDFYKDIKLSNNYLKLMRRQSYNKYKEELISTKSIIYEFLSTEMVTDYGLITNINFKYLTTNNLDSKDKNNCVQNGVFNLINKNRIINNELDEEELNININKTNHDNNFNTKLIIKNINYIMQRIEEKFEQDDYLKLNKLESSFNFFLIDTCYNYLKRIELENKL